MNLLDEKKDFGFITMVLILTLLVLIICTCNGQRSTLEHQTIENQTDSFLYFGKLAKQITGVTECAILKTDDLDFHLCPQQNSLIKLQYQLTQGLVYSASLEQMPRKCLQIKLYQYPLIIHFSSNQFKTVWIGQRLSCARTTATFEGRFGSALEPNGYLRRTFAAALGPLFFSRMRTAAVLGALFYYFFPRQLKKIT